VAASCDLGLRFEFIEVAMLHPTLAATISADYAGLIALFARKLGDRALAEDLVNQAFVESLDKLARQQIADPARFSGFVYGVAFNLLRNHRRRMDNRRENRAGLSALDHLASSASLFDDLSDESVAAVIRHIVAELPIERDREVMRRFYLEEQQKAAICADLGLSSLHFDKIVFRARRRMRRLMDAHGIEPSDALPARDVSFAWPVAVALE
jgi:RNA polymerase sigma-70 factor (ECF subfamily)